MIIVIADDLVGAAEIAGIGHSYGLTTTLITEMRDNLPVCDLIVIATETRSMSEADAVNETHNICQQIKSCLPKLSEARQAAMTPLQRAQALAHPNEVLHIFKKTDVLLRGNIHLELRALIEESRYEQVMFTPACPSKGLVIRGGRFFANGTPIDHSAVKTDDGYRVPTANVADAINVRPGSRLRICDAEDQQDLQRMVRLALKNHTPSLLAGSGELFSTLLTELGHKPSRHKQFPGLSEKGAALIVCGSNQSQDHTQMPYVIRHNMSVTTLPHEVFETVASLSITEKEGADRWMGRLKQSQLVNGKSISYILTVPYPTPESKSSATAIHNMTAEMTKRMVMQSSPNEIVIEEGATIFAVFRKLGWTRFQVTNVISPGIVRLHSLDAAHTHITINPTSAVCNELYA